MHAEAQFGAFNSTGSSQCCLCCLKFCIFSASGLLITFAVLGSAAHSLAIRCFKSLKSGQSLCTEAHLHEDISSYH